MTATPTPPPARTRHDAFEGARRRVFLDALGRCGCLRDAARKAGVSHQTVYNHQASDREFARQCELALQMASTDIELHAWERGVVGVEEPIVHRGEIIGTRLKRSDAILRLLLQGARPKKYGPNPGIGRRRLHKLERERIEREVRAEWREHKRHLVATREETNEAILKKLRAMARQQEAEAAADAQAAAARTRIDPGRVPRIRTPALGDPPPALASRPAPVERAALAEHSVPGAEQIPDSV